MAKQTGPGCGVKVGRAATVAAVVAIAALISGCGSTWQHPHKSAKEMALDERICVVQSEEDAMARAAKQQETYGARPGPNPGLNRGESPLEMHDRVHTEADFNRAFENCMTSKGYYERSSAAK